MEKKLALQLFHPFRGLWGLCWKLHWNICLTVWVILELERCCVIAKNAPFLVNLLKALLDKCQKFRFYRRQNVPCLHFITKHTNFSYTYSPFMQIIYIRVSQTLFLRTHFQKGFSMRPFVIESLDVNDTCKHPITNLKRHFSLWRNHANAHNSQK